MLTVRPCNAENVYPPQEQSSWSGLHHRLIIIDDPPKSILRGGEGYYYSVRCLEEERERERKEGRKERKERRKEERKEGRKEERKEEKKGEERFNRGKLSFIFDRPPFSPRIEIYYRARSTRVPLLPQLFVSFSTHCTTRIHNSLLEKKKGEKEKEREKKRRSVDDWMDNLQSERCSPAKNARGTDGPGDWRESSNRAHRRTQDPETWTRNGATSF